MVGRVALLLLALAPSAVISQLRPRRVGGAGVNAMGQQEEVQPDDDVGAAGLAGLEAGLKEALGGADLGDLSKFGDLSALGDLAKGGNMLDALGGLEGLAENPLIKNMAAANPELAKLLGDPEQMKEKMAEVAQMMSSDEGQEMAQKMMAEMGEVLADPEKLQQGLQQLKDNPALKGLADSVPGLSEMLNDPEQLRAQTEKTAEMFAKFQDPEMMQQMLEQAGGMEGIQKHMQQMMGAMGNGDMDSLKGMMEGLAGGDVGEGGLKDRVDRLMQEAGMGEHAAEIEDEF